MWLSVRKVCRNRFFSKSISVFWVCLRLSVKSRTLSSIYERNRRLMFQPKYFHSKKERSIWEFVRQANSQIAMGSDQYDRMPLTIEIFSAWLLAGNVKVQLVKIRKCPFINVQLRGGLRSNDPRQEASAKTSKTANMTQEFALFWTNFVYLSRRFIVLTSQNYKVTIKFMETFSIFQFLSTLNRQNRGKLTQIV